MHEAYANETKWAMKFVAFFPSFFEPADLKYMV